MNLKYYQQRALDDLADFMRRLDRGKPIEQTFSEFWLARDVKAPAYLNNLRNVPRVCFKVPTGGGKTFMAAKSLRVIFDELLILRNRMVVWLVPSEAILTQTYKNLSDAAHDYRRAIDTDFGGRVGVYNKEQLLAGENFSPATISEQLSILVLTYDSFRTRNKIDRRVNRQNGQLISFAAQTCKDKFLADADETSLITVVRHYNPVVIVDESHHATTDLSVNMLEDFNPSFILELTATPKNTNVINRVSAAELKAESMIKLPVVACNLTERDDVITEAINFRNSLEDVGRFEKIRPIVLFQAESQGDGDRATFDRIKSELIGRRIPPAQIAIKTAGVNDLRGVDLMAEDCPIRYIITVNALKEGWDCPFAYVLASLANRTSVIDVEQILGRILRRPFTKNFSAEMLNRSYVLTSSNDFRATLDKIIVGLNFAGFDERDCSVAEKIGDLTKTPPEFDYDSETEERGNVTEFKMRDEFAEDARNLRLPQFVTEGDEPVLIDAENNQLIDFESLSAGFLLAGKNADVNFAGIDSNVAEFDIHGAENFPSCKFLNDAARNEFLEYFDTLSDEGKIRQCTYKITGIVDRRRKSPPTSDIRNYVRRVVETFDNDRLRDAMLNAGEYAKKIAGKINYLQAIYARDNFIERFGTEIFIAPHYKFPEKISPPKHQSWANSLYEAEETVNDFEYRFVKVFTAAKNIRWWHRNRVNRDGFRLNCFLNHYPDFILRMKSGATLIVEAKGDDRDNSDSKLKLEIGKFWSEQSTAANLGEFAYFMVFDNNPLVGALNFDDFVQLLAKI